MLLQHHVRVLPEEYTKNGLLSRRIQENVSVLQWRQIPYVSMPPLSSSSVWTEGSHMVTRVTAYGTVMFELASLSIQYFGSHLAHPFNVWMVIRMKEQRVMTHHSVRLAQAMLLGH